MSKLALSIAAFIFVVAAIIAFASVGGWQTALVLLAFAVGIGMFILRTGDV